MTDTRVLPEAEAFRIRARAMFDGLRQWMARGIAGPARYHPVAGLDMFLNPERLSRHFKAADQGAADGRNNHPVIDADELTAFEAGVRMKCNDALLRLKRQTDAALIGYEAKLFAIDIPPAGAAIGRIEVEADRRFQIVRDENKAALIQLAKDELLAERDFRQFVVEHRLRRGPKPLHKLRLTFALLILMILVEGLANAAIFTPLSAFGLVGGFAFAALIAICNVTFAFLIGMFLLRNWIHFRLHRRIMAGIATVAAVALLLFLQFTLAKFRAMIESPADLPTLSGLLHQNVEWSLPSGVLFVISLGFACIAMADGFCFAGDPYPGYSAMARQRLDASDAFKRRLTKFKANAIVLNRTAQNEVGALAGEARDAVFKYQALTAEFRSLVTLYEQNAHQIENACDRVIKDYREKNLFVRTEAAPAYFEEYVPLDWAIGREIGDPGERLVTFTAALDDMEAEAEDAKTRLHNRLNHHLQEIDEDLAAIEKGAAVLFDRENSVFKHANDLDI